MPDELWTEVCDIVQETGIKTISMEKKCKKAKWLSEEALQIAVKRREVKRKEKERYTHLNAEFQRIARRDKKAFLSDQCTEREELKVNCTWNNQDAAAQTTDGHFEDDCQRGLCSVCASCPPCMLGRVPGVVARVSSLGQMAATPPSQWPDLEVGQAFLSTKLACLLAFEWWAARPHILFW